MSETAPAPAPPGPTPVVFGMLQIHLRGGSVLEVPLRETEARIQSLMADLVQDIEKEAAHRDARQGQLFQLRPGLWLRCGQVVALAFSPEGQA